MFWLVFDSRVLTHSVMRCERMSTEFWLTIKVKPVQEKSGLDN